MSSTRKMLTDVQVKLLRGCKAEELKDYSAAIMFYLEAVNLCNENEIVLKARAYSSTGDCYQALDAWEEASTCYYHAAKEYMLCAQYRNAYNFFILASSMLEKSSSAEKPRQIAQCLFDAVKSLRSLGKKFSDQINCDDLVFIAKTIQFLREKNFLHSSVMSRKSIALQFEAAADSLVKASRFEEAMVCYEYGYQYYVAKALFRDAGRCKKEGVRLKRLLDMLEPHLITPPESFQENQKDKEVEASQETASTSQMRATRN